MNKSLHKAVENSESLQFYRTFHKQLYMPKGSDLIQGSFIRKALFGYET